MASARRLRGQAMVEFVLGAVLFLIPMFLIVPLIGKYLDVRSTTVQAARYVAWERTVWYGGAAASVDWPAQVKSDGEIQNEVRQRFFSEGTGISNNDKGAANWASGGSKQLLFNRDGSSMLQSYGDIGAAVTNADTPGLVNDVLTLAVTVADALGPFTLEMKGLYTGQVSTAVYTLPVNMALDGSDTFNPGTLSFTEKNVILSNTWSANGHDHVKSQTLGLAPLGIFQKSPIKEIMEVALCLLTPFAPEVYPGGVCFGGSPRIEIGKIEPDVVPPDRLGE